MKEIIYIFIGGGMGSVTRYLTQIAVNERLSPALFPFPWGTFAVNIIGSLLIGFFLFIFGAFQSIFRTEAISDRWFLWRFYHILHFGQRQSEFAERRFLWHIHLLCIHQHFAWTFGCIGRRISWRTI